MQNQIESWLIELQDRAINRKNLFNSKKENIKSKKRYIWYSKIKNKEIKEKLSSEGEKLTTKNFRFSSRSSAKCASSGGEWLYDFTLRKFDSSGNFIGVKLVSEIELSDFKVGGLIYDFNKLLQSDAEYKLFVFQQKTESDGEKVIARLEAALKAYNHRNASKYIIACWVTSDYKFIFEHRDT